MDWQSPVCLNTAPKADNIQTLSKYQPLSPPPAPCQQSNIQEPLVHVCAQPEHTVIAASAHNAARSPATLSSTAPNSHMPLASSPEALPFPRSARCDALFATFAPQTAFPNTQLPIDAAAMQPDGNAAQNLRHGSQTGCVLDESVHSLLQLLPGAVRLPVHSHLTKLDLNG